MTASDLIVGQQYRYGHGRLRIVTLLVAEPDRNGYVIASHDGYYSFVLARHLTPIAKQYTVELRVPRVGERYLAYGTVFTAGNNFTSTWPVIVDEVDQ